MRWLAKFANKKSLPAVHCAIGDFRVSLQSELRHVLDDFVTLYPLFHAADVKGKPVINLDVRRAGRTRFGRSRYQVFADGEEVGGPHTGECVFPLVEWGINLRIMATRSEFTQLHASSMAYRSRGFIFAGDSGCGKSTLAACLLASGWQYLCDEFALVRGDSLTLHPFPKALCIKSGSYPIIQTLGVPFARRRDYVKAFKGRVAYINPREVGSNRISPPVPAQYILFPTLKSDRRAHLTPMAKSEAAMELYRCCFNKGVLPEFGLPTVTRLVLNTQCYRLDVGKPAETAALLSSLCREAPLQARVDTSANHAPAPAPARRGIDRLASRREALKLGAKLAYVAPVALTLTSRQAFAAASDPSGICSTASHTGQLCETDMDCCSRQCALGVCR